MSKKNLTQAKQKSQQSVISQQSIKEIQSSKQQNIVQNEQKQDENKQKHDDIKQIDKNLTQEKQEEQKQSTNDIKQLDPNLTQEAERFKQYIEENGISQAFQLIFKEIIVKNIPEQNIYQYAAMRLRQIGNDLNKLLHPQQKSNKSFQTTQLNQSLNKSLKNANIQKEQEETQKIQQDNIADKKQSQ